ncbi:MAG: helix-turn-helix transcriptional regulator [Candidatus Hodarchaeales archaeon]|jgi:predicted ArsR family transcriptional regulator
MLSLKKTDFKTKREKILQYLLLNRSPTGEKCSLKEIAKAIGLSATGIRHYLNTMENEGLISYTERQGKTGRPSMIYSLTEMGLNAFPKAYAEFSIDLLDEIKSRFGENVTLEILQSIGSKNARMMLRGMTDTLEKGKSLDSLQQKLSGIVEVFRGYGKFPELIEEKSSYILKNYNCLYYDIVKDEPMVCMVTETVISELTDSEVTKEQCLRDGDESCLFRINKTK